MAVFPDLYSNYVDRLKSQGPQINYLVVSRGDTLWKIARRHSTSVQAVKRTNGLRSNSDLRPGRFVIIPL